MFLTSPDFESGSFIPIDFTCDGQNISPELLISEAPAETKSLALIVDDPDAPGGDWTHWLAWNIEAKTSIIKKGEVPQGVIQGRNDFAKNSYGGPCPPKGIHHYHFKIYALDSFLDLASECGKADLIKAMRGHILEEFDLPALYTRAKRM